MPYDEFPFGGGDLSRLADMFDPRKKNRAPEPKVSPAPNGGTKKAPVVIENQPKPPQTNTQES